MIERGVEPSSSPSVSPEIKEAFNFLTDLKSTNDENVIENFIKLILPFTEDPQNKNYIIRRLAKGVTSTRKAARFPFANALWAFLKTDEACDVPGDAIYQILQKETELNRLLKLKTFPDAEQAELMGCLIVCLTLVKVRCYVNMQFLSTLHQKILSSNIEVKNSFFTLYDTFLFESLEIISKQDYVQSLWPAFSVAIKNLKEEMSYSVAIELFMLIRRFPKLVSQFVSVDRNNVDNVNYFSLDKFILFNIGKVPFVHPSMSSFLKTFNVGSKMFEKFWYSLLQRTETTAFKLAWLLIEKKYIDFVSEKQMKVILNAKFLTELNNMISKSCDAGETVESFKNWFSNLSETCRLPFLWYILQNCSKCPRILSSSIFQVCLTQEDIKKQRAFFLHVEKQIFLPSTKMHEVDTLVTFVSKFSSGLEQSEQKSLQIRTLIDKMLIRVSFTKVSSHKKAIRGKTADVLFHAIRSRLLSAVGDFAQEIFNFVSNEDKTASVAADLILNSDSVEIYPYIKQLIAVLILDICIHNEVEEAYVSYLKSLLQNIRKIPLWLNKKDAKVNKTENNSVFEIQNVVLVLIKLMNIPNKFYHHLATSCFKFICEEHLTEFDEDLFQKILNVHEKLASVEDAETTKNENLKEEVKEKGDSSNDEAESSDEDSEYASEPGGEAPWEQEYFAKQEAQVELNESLDPDQVAQLEKFDEMWELKMRSQEKQTFQVSEVNSISNFFHLLNTLLKDSCDESIMKSCFVFCIDILAQNPKQENFGVTFEMCSKIWTLGEKKCPKTLKRMSPDEGKEMILKIMKAIFCSSFSLKKKMYSTACKVVSAALTNCTEDCTTYVFKCFKTEYFLPWVNHGKCLNVSHFLNALFQFDPSLFWLFLMRGSVQGKKLVLAGNSSALKRINLVLTLQKLSQIQATDNDFLFFIRLCHTFLDAALSTKSLVQKQICIQTVHMLSKSLKLKTSNSVLNFSQATFERLKENVSQLLDCFKSVDVNQSCLHSLRGLASDFDIDVNTNDDLSYLRKRKANSQEKRKKSGNKKKKRRPPDSSKHNATENEMQGSENWAGSPKKKLKTMTESEEKLISDQVVKKKKRRKMEMYEELKLEDAGNIDENEGKSSS